MMIKNERQYKITKAELERFQRALKDIPSNASRNRLHPLLRSAEIAAIESQIADLREQIAEYDALRSGSKKVAEVGSLDELPRLLIRARIAAGMNQRDLAEKLGLKEQQIQRYEATDYSSASFSRVLEVARILGLSIKDEVDLASASSSPWRDMEKRLQRAGIDKELLLERLLPRELSYRLEGKAESLDTDRLMAAAFLSRVFGWKATSVLEGSELKIEVKPSIVPQFKLPKLRNEPRLAAYVVYAHYLALITLQATDHLPARRIPNSASAFRKAVLDEFGECNLPSCLEYVWGLGIPVLPLSGSGAFHAACWRVDGRNVIVLKQRTRSEGRWLFDLLHEVNHAMSNPRTLTQAILDVEGEPTQDTDEEQDASEFAGDVMLGGRAEYLAKKCVDSAQGKVEYLKRVVPQVAVGEGVSVDALANYLAYRLSLQGINWWGAAANLQTEAKRQHPWEIARDLFMGRVNLDSLNEVDRVLLTQALNEGEAGY